MKILLKSTLTLCLLLLSISASAGLYKGLDADGNTVYSDKPFDNAEKITPPPITVVDAPKVPAKTESVTEKETVADTSYKSFRITSPKNNATIWNNPDLTIQLTVTPKLNTQAGDNIWLLLDGKTIVKNSKSLSIPVGRYDRGEHKVVAQLKNKSGKTLMTSNAVTLHIKNSVARPVASPR